MPEKQCTPEIRVEDDRWLVIREGGSVSSVVGPRPPDSEWLAYLIHRYLHDANSSGGDRRYLYAGDEEIWRCARRLPDGTLCRSNALAGTVFCQEHHDEDGPETPFEDLGSVIRTP
jgi:hypothetical protein